MNTKANSFFTQTTPFALLIGCCFAIASYFCYRNSGYVFNNITLERTISLLFITGLFMSIRRYRNSEIRSGHITYAQALLAGIWISAMAGAVYCLYTILLYTVHPELLNFYWDTVREAIGEIYKNSRQEVALLQFFKAILSPVFIGVSELFGKFVHGLIYTLILAAFLRKS